MSRRRKSEWFRFQRRQVFSSAKFSTTPGHADQQAEAEGKPDSRQWPLLNCIL